MKVINDRDTRDFIDGSGDRLTLLVAPRLRDKERIEKLEQQAAFEAIKLMGLDVEKIQREAQHVEAEQDMLSDDFEVRKARLEALCMSMTIGGQLHGGQAVLAQYELMDPASGRWVDECVAEVWKAAKLSDAERERTGADAEMPAGEGIGTA